MCAARAPFHFQAIGGGAYVEGEVREVCYGVHVYTSVTPDSTGADVSTTLYTSNMEYTRGVVVGGVPGLTTTSNARVAEDPARRDKPSKLLFVNSTLRTQASAVAGVYANHAQKN